MSKPEEPRQVDAAALTGNAPPKYRCAGCKANLTPIILSIPEDGKEYEFDCPNSACKRKARVQRVPVEDLQ